jgi:uncharacterized protein (DUF305 family)
MKIVLTLAVAVALAAPAHAQGMQHGTHGAPAAASGTATGVAPSTVGFQNANKKMHEGMDIAFTGNADVDFVKGMIPHHQGAIDMAKVVVAHGKDPQVKKLAREIIKAQESEIALMQAWLKKNAK